MLWQVAVQMSCSSFDSLDYSLEKPNFGFGNFLFSFKLRGSDLSDTGAASIDMRHFKWKNRPFSKASGELKISTWNKNVLENVVWGEYALSRIKKVGAIRTQVRIVYYWLFDPDQLHLVRIVMWLKNYSYPGGLDNSHPCANSE